MIRTVLGDVETVVGRVLAHEHLVLDLTGQKNPDVVLGAAEEPEIVADLIAASRDYGLSLVVDLSVPGSGRDLDALARISHKAGIHVVAATGQYWDPFPKAVLEGTRETLVTRMIEEITVGQSNGVRCGVIKIGTPRGTPGDDARRLFSAAADAARETGAAVVAHTSTPDQIAWQIACLRDCGLPADRTLISHFGKAPLATLFEAGSAGVYLGIDQIGFASGPGLAELAAMVKAAIDAGLQDRLILSSDMARRTRLHKFGGTSYSTVFSQFLPHLQAAGLAETIIETMLHDNPLRLLNRVNHNERNSR